MIIFSHNIGRYLSDYSYLNAIIVDSDADIVILQEITSKYIHEYSNNLRDLYPYQTYGPFHDEKEKVGMGILSRYPVVEFQDFKLDEQSLVNQQRVAIDFDGDYVVIYNVHLTFPWIGIKRDPFIALLPIPFFDDHTRHKEIEQLCSMIQNERAPVVLAGDFNMTDRSSDYAHLSKLMTDAHKIYDTHPKVTWPANRTPSLYIPFAKPFIRIDYVFYSEDFRVKSALALHKTGSDHLPLLTELEIAIKHGIDDGSFIHRRVEAAY
jgi:endonuclease/exonuclease/phosphatase family metal-dependent hydrolase